MARRALATLCAVLLVAGCGRVRRVDPTADSAALAELRERTAYGVVEIEFAGGERRSVARFRIEGDTVTWKTPGPSREISTAPLADIRAIRVPAVGGALGRTIVGVGLGLIGGALLGVGVVWASTTPVSDPDAADVVVLLGEGTAGMLLGAALGGLVGGVVGASIRPKDVFKLTAGMDSARAVEDTIDVQPSD